MVLSMERWVGKVAVVTGASAGIGKAIAEKLVDHGLIVIGLARRVELIEEHAEELKGRKGKLHGVKVDMADTQQILDAFENIEENHGAVHILINNAGVIFYTSLCDGDIEKWKKTFDINVIGLSVATREAIRSMKRHNIEGHVVHLNSTDGHKVTPYLGTNVYPASKFAVTALAENLRYEFAKAGSKIKITSLSPGLVKTEIFDIDKFEQPESIGDFDQLPILNPEDIADGCIFALSTPPHVQVEELTITPVGELFQ